MKKLMFMSFLLFVSMGMVYSQSLNVTSPATGVNWQKGQSKSITWTKSGTMDANVKITLRNQDDSLHTVLTMSTPNDGNYPWTIPASIPDGDYMIRVKTTDNEVWDNSGVFTISSGSVTFTLQPSQAHVLLIPKPDLKVTITPTPVSPGVGQKTIVAFKTTNIGEGKSKDTVMKAFVGQHPKGAWNVGELQPGDHYTKTVEMTPEGVGYYLWNARVDENNNIGDSKRANNYVKFKQIIRGPDLLVAFNQSVRPTLATKENIYAWVKNKGTYKSTQCTISFYLKNKGTKTFIVPALNPGQVHKLSRNEKWFTVGNKRVSITINPGNTMPESNFSNNHVEGNIKVITAFGTKYVVTSYICSNGNTGVSLNDVW